MKNDRTKKVVAVFCLILVVLFFFGFSIADLVNKKDVHELEITEAAQILVVENSINGIIPTGKDYYYVGYCKSDDKIYLIHAGKNWLTKNFSSDGRSKDIEGLHIKALEKRAADYEVEKELAVRMQQIDELTPALGYGRVLELNYVRDALIKLFAGIMIALTGVIYFLIKKEKVVSDIWPKALAVSALVTVALVLVAVL